tara:strand:+ start:543 stop:764 length:222 start_codon:yes stop_codon:yes gene_type:complete
MYRHYLILIEGDRLQNPLQFISVWMIYLSYSSQYKDADDGAGNDYRPNPCSQTPSAMVFADSFPVRAFLPIVL